MPALQHRLPLCKTKAAPGQSAAAPAAGGKRVAGPERGTGSERPAQDGSCDVGTQLAPPARSPPRSFSRLEAASRPSWRHGRSARHGRARNRALPAKPAAPRNSARGSGGSPAGISRRASLQPAPARAPQRAERALLLAKLLPAAGGVKPPGSRGRPCDGDGVARGQGGSAGGWRQRSGAGRVLEARGDGLRVLWALLLPDRRCPGQAPQAPSRCRRAGSGGARCCSPRHCPTAAA